MRDSDNPRHGVKNAVVLSQCLLGELGIDPLTDRRQQASFVAIIKSRQIRRRVEFRRQQEGGHTKLGEYVLHGGYTELGDVFRLSESGGCHKLGAYVLADEFFNLVLGEDLLQAGRLPVVRVEQSADIPALGLREPYRAARMTAHPFGKIVSASVDDPEGLAFGKHG